MKSGRDFGLSDTDIRAISDGFDGKSSGLGPLEQLVLRAAREMTSGRQMSAQAFAALHDHLGDEGIVDLTVVIGFYNGVVRVLASLDIDVEPDYRRYLDEFPLG